MKHFLFAATVAATLVGCAAPAHVSVPSVDRPPFPAAEYAALPKTGTAAITGQAFLKTRGGDVKVGAGEHVALYPVTSYSTFAYEKRYLQGMDISGADPRHADYVRTTTADATGRFTFKDLPPGDYYVQAQVRWEAPYHGQLIKQGGWIEKRVTAKNGETAEVMLTR